MARPARQRQKTTRSEAYMINVKYLGAEPTFTGEVSELEYGKALSWYNYMNTVDDARTYLNDYLAPKKLTGVPDVRINMTAAWISRMLKRGYKLPPSAIPFLDCKLAEMISFKKEDAPSVKEGSSNVISIRDRINEKASNLIADIEELLDKGEAFSLYDMLQKSGAAALYAPMIIEKYAPILDELIEAHEGNDEDLRNAYNHLSDQGLLDRIKFYNLMIEDAERYGTNTKKVRKPRKPRAVSMEKKLKTFKFQKEDKEFKLVSINPEKIIGASELWAYNSKYKTLTVLRALDRAGLTVKGTSILNYDEAASQTKRIGRRTEEYLKKVLTGGKIILRKLMDEIKGDVALAYRTSDNTILLKVV